MIFLPIGLLMEKKIVFYSTRDENKENEGDNTEIYIMNRDGSHQKRLTENKHIDIMPDFSPDGKEIAFCSDRNEKKAFDIFVMDSDGKNQKNITKSNMAIEKGPDWICQNRIIFERLYFIEGNLKITEETLEKAAEEEIEIEKIKTLKDKSLSLENLQKELSRLNFKDDEITAILSQAIQERKIYSHIFTIKKDGTELKKLTDTNCKDHSPAISPDKSKVAFTREEGEGGFLNIYIMNIDGTNLRAITKDGVYHDECPAWSLDGEKIAFSSWRGKGRSLYIIDIDGTGEYSLLPPCPKDDILPALK